MPTNPRSTNEAPSGTSTSLGTILAQFREDARSNRDLGDRFERLIVAFLRLDPLYVDLFSDVWLWNDWPGKGKVGDVGIDIVAQERATGDHWAIQCKFYLPEHTISKEDIDSFFTAAGRDPFTACMVVTTTDRWGKNAEDALQQTKRVMRLSLHDLEQSPIDWSRFDMRRPQALRLRPKKALRPHQQTALDAVVAGLKRADRGKLIMACGTGKTFTALRIAERMAPRGQVLFLVPSLSLLAQSLREWTAEAEAPLHALAVCSDAGIGKRRASAGDDLADITLHDLAFPATTSAKEVVAQHEGLSRRRGKDGRGMSVVFSTYQSIDAVSKAQRAGLPEFDLVICDEAHRTTGVTFGGEDESHFVKVHDAKFLRARKRLYMTATPRIYGDEAKGRAREADAAVCSMDDAALFGDELHRLGFGEAVGKSLLSDYRVLVLAVDEKYVSKTFQRQIADASSELNLDDAVKITGCWNGLAKRFASDPAASPDLQGDLAPMRRAVAFSRSIRDSKAFVERFRQIVTTYRELRPDDEGLLDCELDHVDGTYPALRRGALLDWLKAEPPGQTCRILSNARCLSEGVDVPALDAVLFLNPRNSVIDVVQSVGRVMRRAEGKRYGYIILPVGIPADVRPEEALKDNEKYRVVWQVLQALRAHDDRFNATINHIELNEHRPDNIQVIGVMDPSPEQGTAQPGDAEVREVQASLSFSGLEEWRDAIYGRIVLKCGDRRYWEDWAKDVAVIAERHTTRIKALLEGRDRRHAKAFDEFLAGLRHNLNPAVSPDDAVEMLSQHLITRPVFDALFAGYEFTKRNPVSQAMQRMLDALHDEALEKETTSLERFYESVRTRAQGIDNAEGRQRVVIELYDKFFRTAFPRMAERLGIVYTPVEVVDFIVRSVEDVLRDEFGSGLGSEDVHIIDPFTGTGTFLVRLLQSGLVQPRDLLRKYRRELHANEIVLLAYYIAAINIEEAFHRQRAGGGEYVPFEGIVLTDTFQLYEPRGDRQEHAFPENDERVARQKRSPIRVVIANPPYSAQQDSENDNNKNLAYPHLDQRIRSTYAERSSAKLVKNLYDSYVRAIRWASDRIAERGVIGIVTNGSFIDANNMDGLRACLAEEFSTVYVLNMRGNARTQGEQRRMEAGSVFDAGTRTPVAITLLVKNPAKRGSRRILYHDIGDYLTREEKLSRLSAFGSVGGIAAANGWTALRPNASHDWINQRDPAFDAFIPLGSKEDESVETVFSTYSLGVVTNRDAWTYNMSRTKLRATVRALVGTYAAEMARYRKACRGLPRSEWPDIGSVVDMDPKRISWTRALKADATRGKELEFREDAPVVSMYRPFTKQWLYFDRRLNEMVYQMPSLFPTPEHGNLVIAVSGIGASKGFSALIAGCIPNLHMHDTGQSFPLYWYERVDEQDGGLLAAQDEVVGGYRRRSGVTEAILARFRGAYGPSLTDEDVFYYVYGVLHSPEYRERFAADLKRMLPRLPMTHTAESFRRFSTAGRELASWHLGYETVDPYPLEEVGADLGLGGDDRFVVQKMTFGRRGKEVDRTTIHYSSRLSLRGIPPDAYDYVVNGKPAIEWIMERYQVSRDRDSGIVNDPNDWAREHNQPRYIVDLVKRIVRVSVETVRIVKALPALNEQPMREGR